MPSDRYAVVELNLEFRHHHKCTITALVKEALSVWVHTLDSKLRNQHHSLSKRGFGEPLRQPCKCLPPKRVSTQNQTIR